MPVKSRVSVFILFLAVPGWLAAGILQDLPDSYVTHRNQIVRINGLPMITARSSNESAILEASLATALMDPHVCCEQGSALADQMWSFASLSLDQLGAKLQGRYKLNSGQPVTIAARYSPASSATADSLIATLMTHHPLLMKWN